MSDIKKEIEMELKPYETMCDQTTEHLKMLITGSCEASADEILTVAKALGEITDIKKDIVEMCYKKKILEAMEESEFGADYDEEGPIERKFYRGQARDSKGRYMSRMYQEPNYRMTPEMYKNHSAEEMRDMDKHTKGVMYYTEAMDEKSMSAFDKAKEEYMAAKNSGSSEEKVHKLNKMLDELNKVLDKVAVNVGNEERTIIRTKLQNKVNAL